MIGAGISGLAAAKTLKDANIDVIVLESADQIGGRACSVVKQDYYINYGADFICGIDDEDGRSKELKEIALKAGLKTFLPDWDDMVFYQKGGEIIPQEEEDQQRSAYIAAMEWI